VRNKKTAGQRSGAIGSCDQDRSRFCLVSPLVQFHGAEVASKMKNVAAVMEVSLSHREETLGYR
jgi:predicted nucleic acid binding AN1-type Zn finger protein